MTPITALILAYNEEPNIGRTLSRLGWATEIVVLDSCSSDATCDIAARYPKVRIVKRPFTTLADQWNYGLESTQITTEWVLALDADYFLSDELIAELSAFDPTPDVAGYVATFDYCIHGRKLRSGVYPPVTVLFRRSLTHVEQDAHCQRARVKGALRPLRGRIAHDDRKSMGRWLASQATYMKQEADKLADASPDSLSAIDRLRKAIVVAPIAVFVYCLVVKGGLFDGWPGVLYASQRATAEAILSMTLIERRLRGAR
jgi:glycosyltransferase involved in cell wall biosynthesis